MGMPWVKIYVSILDDMKMARLTDAQKWRFVQLIILANECDAGGAIVTGVTPVTPGDVTWRLRCDEKTLTNDIEKMVDLGLLHYEEDVLVVSKFNERQGPTQEKQRKEWRERQKRHRERVKRPNVTHVTQMSPSDVTPMSQGRLRIEEDSIALDSASEKLPDIVKNPRAFQALQKHEDRREQGKADLAWLDEYLWPLAQEFIEATTIVPLRTEYSKWRKDLKAFYDAGVGAEKVKPAVNKCRKDGLTIKAPASIFAIARDMTVNKPNEKFAEEW